MGMQGSMPGMAFIDELICNFNTASPVFARDLPPHFLYMLRRPLFA